MFVVGVQTKVLAVVRPSTPIAFPFLESCGHNSIGSCSCCSLEQMSELVWVLNWKKRHWAPCGRGKVQANNVRKISGVDAIVDRKEWDTWLAILLIIPGIEIVTSKDALLGIRQSIRAQMMHWPCLDLLDAPLHIQLTVKKLLHHNITCSHVRSVIASSAR